MFASTYSFPDVNLHAVTIDIFRRRRIERIFFTEKAASFTLGWRETEI